MTPGGPLPPPDQNPQGATPGGGFPSPAPPAPDPTGMAQGWMSDIVMIARRLGIKYPDLLPEVRDIAVAVQKMGPKLLSAAPAPEPMSPPV